MLKRWLASLGVIAVATPLLFVGSAEALSAASSAQTEITITKLSDGTGHGTDSASPLTSAKGFSPADDTPNDGVVSSFDSVRYRVKISFLAGNARTVSLRFDSASAPYLDPQIKDLCIGSQGVTAKYISNNDSVCEFGVSSAGAVQEITREIIVKARDSYGVPRSNQRLTINAEYGGTESFSADKAVTVISVPNVDLWFKYDNNNTGFQKRLQWQETGQLCETFNVVAGRMETGANSYKGSSVGGPWSGTFDASKFPIGTTFKRGADTLHIVTATGDNKFRLVNVGRTENGERVAANTGDITFCMPVDQPIPGGDDSTKITSMKVSDIWDIPLQLIPDRDSFVPAGGVANGSLQLQEFPRYPNPDSPEEFEPGANRDKDFNSRTNWPYAISGSNGFPNNDWLGVRIVRASGHSSGDGDAGGARIKYNIFRPYKEGYYLFDKELTSFAYGNLKQANNNRCTNCITYRNAAPGTEFIGVTEIEVWQRDPNEQVWDPHSQMLMGNIWAPAMQTYTGGLHIKYAGVGGWEEVDLNKLARNEYPTLRIEWLNLEKAARLSDLPWDPDLYADQYLVNQLDNVDDSVWEAGLPPVGDRRVAGWRLKAEQKNISWNIQQKFELHGPVTVDNPNPRFKKQTYAEAISSGIVVMQSLLDGTLPGHQSDFLTAVKPPKTKVDFVEKPSAVGSVDQAGNVSWQYVDGAADSVQAQPGNRVNYFIQPKIIGLAKSNTVIDNVALRICASPDQYDFELAENGTHNWMLTTNPRDEEWAKAWDLAPVFYDEQSESYRQDVTSSQKYLNETCPRAQRILVQPDNPTRSVKPSWRSGTYNPDGGMTVDIPGFNLIYTLGNKAHGTVQIERSLQRSHATDPDNVIPEFYSTARPKAVRLAADVITEDSQFSILRAVDHKMLGSQQQAKWIFNMQTRNMRNFEGAFNRGGYSETVLRFPFNGDILMRSSEWNGLADQPVGYSNFNGTFALAGEPVIDENNSTTTSMLYSTSVLSTDDPNNAVWNWRKWSELSDFEKKNITAIKLRSAFDSKNDSDGNETERLTATRGTITLNTSGMVNGNRMVMWLGRTFYGEGPNASRPWGDYVETVADHSLSGTVWWDDSREGVIDAGEARIPDIEVWLWRASYSGTKLDPQPLSRTHTDAQGNYTFKNVVPGSYVVETKRYEGRRTNDGVQTKNRSYYNTDRDVLVTRAGTVQNPGTAVSQPIHFEYADVTGQDFGFARDQVKVQLDKTRSAVSCDGNYCDVEWKVRITNSGKHIFGDPTKYLQTIAAGSSHALAIDTSGTLRRWGKNDAGQLGVGNVTDYATPNGGISGIRFRAVSAGTQVSAGIEADTNMLYVWGSGADWRNAQSGSVINLDRSGYTGIEVKAVSLGDAHGLAIKTNGELVAWGRGVECQSTCAAAQVTPVTVQAGKTDWLQVAGGGSHSLALDAAGKVWAWGAGEKGQIGDGLATKTLLPKQLDSLSRKIVQIAAGNNFSLALDSEGNVWAWGANDKGQLGVGSDKAQSNVPVMIDGITEKVVQISAGADHAVLLTRGNKLYTWGSNSHGQLGIVSGTAGVIGGVYKTPQLSQNGKSFAQAQAGGDVTLAVDPSEQLFTWGAAANKQLGVPGATADSAKPLLLAAPSANAKWRYADESDVRNTANKLPLGLSKLHDRMSNELGNVEATIEFEQDGQEPLRGLQGLGISPLSNGNIEMFALSNNGYFMYASDEEQPNSITPKVREDATITHSGQQLQTMTENQRFSKVFYLNDSYGRKYALDDSNHLWGWDQFTDDDIPTDSYSSDPAATEAQRDVYRITDAPIEEFYGNNWINFYFQKDSNGKQQLYSFGSDRREYDNGGVYTDGLRGVNGDVSSRPGGTRFVYPPSQVTAYCPRSTTLNLPYTKYDLTQLAVNDKSVFALDSDGYLWAWGKMPKYTYGSSVNTFFGRPVPLNNLFYATASNKYVRPSFGSTSYYTGYTLDENDNMCKARRDPATRKYKQVIGNGVRSDYVGPVAVISEDNQLWLLQDYKVDGPINVPAGVTFKKLIAPSYGQPVFLLDDQNGLWLVNYGSSPYTNGSSSYVYDPFKPSNYEFPAMSITRIFDDIPVKELGERMQFVRTTTDRIIMWWRDGYVKVPQEIAAPFTDKQVKAGRAYELLPGLTHTVSAEARVQGRLSWSYYLYTFASDGKLRSFTENGSELAMTEFPVSYTPTSGSDSAHAISPELLQADSGSTMRRTYALPWDLPAGATTVFTLKAKVKQGDREKIVHNQAWFDSPATPYSGTPHAREYAEQNAAASLSTFSRMAAVTTAAAAAPLTEPVPVDETNLAANFLENPGDIIGNASCITGSAYTDPSMEHWFSSGNEDSCDQVGARILARNTSQQFGSVTGVYWRDSNRNGVRESTETERFAGVQVKLFRPDGSEWGATTTDEFGVYSFDSAVPVGENGWYLVFAQPTGAVFSPADVGDSDVINDAASNDSDANPQEGANFGRVTAEISFSAPGVKANLDAGAYVVEAMQDMPKTGLGWTIPLMLLFGVCSAVGAAIALRGGRRK